MLRLGDEVVPRKKFVPRTQRPGYKAPRFADESSAWNNPVLLEGLNQARIENRDPNTRAGGRALNETWNALYGYDPNTGIRPSSTPTTLPTDTSTPSGSGPRGSGSGNASVLNALRTMWGMYNRAPDTGLSDELGRITGQASVAGNQGIDSLRSMLSSQTNPYTQRFAAPEVAANPLAAYMAAGGVDSSGVDALRSLLQSSSQQATAADQMMADRMSQTWQNDSLSRQADVGMMQQQFAQQLANSQAAYAAQIAAKQREQKDQWMMKILEMAVQSGTDLSKLGIGF
jgi:hypothetical protein